MFENDLFEFFSHIHPWQPPALFLPVIVLGEYRFGIKVARDRKTREAWLDPVEAAVTVLDMSSETARHYAGVREELRLAKTPIPEKMTWGSPPSPASTICP